MNDTFDEVRDAIADVTGEEQAEPGDSLVAKLFFDDLDFLDLVVNLEDRFGIEIPDSEWGTIDSNQEATVQDVVNLVTKLKGA